MRYISQIFQPVITIPKNAKLKNTEITCKSQKLLLECGLVRPSSSGLFTLLPLAQRALDKLEALVRKCVEAAGAQRIALPALTSEELWARTGRLQQVGTELMKVHDRHDKKYLLAPTHEEAIADLLADSGPLSYKQLPLLLYQISNKYRDEYRPKHGLLRAREFAMMDAYAADSCIEGATHTYSNITEQYRKLFHTLQLPVLRVTAPSGDMGGSLSHEWQLLAKAGEDSVQICPSCSHSQLAKETKQCDKCGKEMEIFNSIEVGHTFILGTKYSEPLGANFTPASGPPRSVVMSCYGLGVTRLLAASIEALSSEKSLRWPRAIAPYSLLVIGPKEGSKEWSSFDGRKLHDLGRELSMAPGLHGDVIIDDRHGLTIGKRLMMADRMGYPIIVVCGKSTLEDPPRFEVYQSTPDQDISVQLLTKSELLQIVKEKTELKELPETICLENK